MTVVTCSTFVSTLQPRSDWQSARIHCNDNYSGSILGKETTKLLLNHVTTYEPGEYIWTNIYHKLSPWIIYKGEISLEKLTSTHSLIWLNCMEDQVIVCASVCVAVVCVPASVRVQILAKLYEKAPAKANNQYFWCDILMEIINGNAWFSTFNCF